MIRILTTPLLRVENMPFELGSGRVNSRPVQGSTQSSLDLGATWTSVLLFWTRPEFSQHWNTPWKSSVRLARRASDRWICLPDGKIYQPRTIVHDSCRVACPQALRLILTAARAGNWSESFYSSPQVFRARCFPKRSGEAGASPAVYSDLFLCFPQDGQSPSAKSWSSSQKTNNNPSSTSQSWSILVPMAEARGSRGGRAAVDSQPTATPHVCRIFWTIRRESRKAWSQCRMVKSRRSTNPQGASSAILALPHCLLYLWDIVLSPNRTISKFR